MPGPSRHATPEPNTLQGFGPAVVGTCPPTLSWTVRAMFSVNHKLCKVCIPACFGNLWGARKLLQKVRLHRIEAKGTDTTRRAEACVAMTSDTFIGKIMMPTPSQCHATGGASMHQRSHGSRCMGASMHQRSHGSRCMVLHTLFAREGAVNTARDILNHSVFADHVSHAESREVLPILFPFHFKEKSAILHSYVSFRTLTLPPTSKCLRTWHI